MLRNYIGDTMREIKFRAWDKEKRKMYPPSSIWKMNLQAYENSCDLELVQYTGLKDKNGSGLTEVYEGDIISEDGTLKGNIYENNKESTDIVIPQLGTKAWDNAYKEAVDRGYDYSE